MGAAFQAANSATYFFIGQHFYRFNDIAFNVRRYLLHFSITVFN